MVAGDEWRVAGDEWRVAGDEWLGIVASAEQEAVLIEVREAKNHAVRRAW